VSRPIDIGELARMLDAKAQILAPELLPRGTRHGNEWVEASTSQGGLGDSLKVNLRRGVWCHWGGGSGARGDMLDLIAYLNFAGNKAHAVEWAKRWLRLDERDPAALQQQRRQAEKRARHARDDDDSRRRAAMKIFLDAQVSIAGTETEHYLLGRGIDFRALGRQPRALRHHRGLAHPETGEIVPAMVAAIVAGDGTMVAVHRTFLERQKSGRVTKLKGVKDAKLSLGRYAGGAIHLWRGSTGKAWKDAEPGEWLTLGEGIEDVGSAVMLNPDRRAAVAISLGNMHAIALPQNIERVIILAQNDPERDKLGRPHPAKRALELATQHFREAGKFVQLSRPPARFKDLNDALTASAS